MGTAPSDDLARGYAKDALLALRGAGYVIVPRDPTEAMVAAGDTSLPLTADDRGNPSNSERYYWDGDAAKVWRAMLEAAEVAP